MNRDSLFSKRYLPWYIAGVLVLMLLIRVSAWRKDTIKTELQSKMIAKSMQLSDALDESFTQQIIFRKPDIRNKDYRKWLGKLNLYQQHLHVYNIYGLTAQAGLGKLAFVTDNADQIYELGSTYQDDGNILLKTYQSKQPQISEPYLRKGRLMISTMIPVANQSDRELKYLIGIDFPADEYVQKLEDSKQTTLQYLLIFTFSFLLVVYLIHRRNLKPIGTRKKLRHIESWATLAAGLFFTLIAVTISEETANQEHESYFFAASTPQQKKIQYNFIGIQSKIDLFVSFLRNSDSITEDEFKNFSENALNNEQIDAVYLYKATIDRSATVDYFSAGAFSYNQKKFQLQYDYTVNNEDIPSYFFQSYDKIIQQSVLNSILNESTYCSEVIIDLAENQSRNYLVLATPVFEKKAGLSSIAMPDISGMLLMIIEPQKVMNHTLRARFWDSEMINFGLYEMKDNHKHDLLAAYPHEHLVEQQADDTLHHMQHLKHQSLIPLFVFGKSYGIIAHSTPQLEKSFGDVQSNLILFSGLLMTFLLFALVRFTRNYWFLLENMISERTENLSLKVKHLTCLKKVGDELQKDQQPDLMINAIIQIMKESCVDEAGYEVSVNFEGNKYGTESRSKSPVIINAPISENGIEKGYIAVCNHSSVKFTKEDTELLEQIADNISMWLSNYHTTHKLIESENRFKALIDNAFDGIYLLEGRRFIYANKAFLKLLEYEKEELMAEAFDLDCLLTEKSKEIVKERFEARQQGLNLEPRYEFQQLTKSGKICDVEVSTIAVKQEGKNIIMGILRDVTERKIAEKALIESEEKLQHQNEELQVLNEELQVTNSQIRDINQDLQAAREKAEAGDRIKTAFLNNISHEVRTPLNGILGATALIGTSELDEIELKELNDIINKSSNRLTRTITQYMDISLLQSGQMECNIAEVDLNELVHKLVNEYTQEAIERKLRLNVTNNLNKQSIYLYTDKELLEKMLSHLIDNAVKFTEKGGVEVIIDADVSKIYFEIKDTGIGIDPAFQKQVFSLFEQEDTGNLRKYDGSGLGLAICHGISRLLSGSIHFKSNKGVGTSFFIEIPIVAEKALKEDSTEKNWSESVDENPGPNILIAEDEESNFIVLSMLLKKRLHATIYRAENGEKAIEMVANNSLIDLVLMDIKMPGVNGLDATMAIKKMRPELPVIAITAYGLTGDESKALAAGCNDYIAKPVATSELLKKISKQISFPIH